MSLARDQGRLELPDSLQAQLHDFRRRVWSTKMAESAALAALVVALAFLAMFAVDRLGETPGLPRLALFAVAILGLAAVPLALRRWVWGNRRLDQLANLLTRKHPHIGDQLLGVIELVHSDSEQARSRALCEAAIVQVAADARRRDFSDSVPTPRHRLWGGLLVVPALAVAALFVLAPAAAVNALARLAAPWRDTPRYTFAAVEALPGTIRVAHGEPFSVALKLDDRTAWSPAEGAARLGTQAPVAARLADGRYVFDFPPQIDAHWLDVSIGDARRHVRIEPTLRPELTGLVADVTLPEYLGRPGHTTRDARGGAVSLVKGSKATFAATASRDLDSARVDQAPRTPSGAKITTDEVVVAAAPRKVVFSWQDKFGLAGKEPFTLAVTGLEDEAPVLATENLPRQKVVLDSETLNFKVMTRDDFGVKRIGMEWQGLDPTYVEKPAKGERVIAAGGSDKDALDIPGTFSAQSLGIEPQPIGLRVYAEDYLPGRPRVYSPVYTLYVLNAEQHAIWVTEQLSKWHRQSLEVRDREKQLYETNKQLRALAADQLDQPDNRRKVDNQANAERANGRRLSGLVMSGEELVRQASRNPEIGVGHLEKWAEMLQVLKDISGKRMPSVADLLKEAAQAPPGQSKPKPPGGNKGPTVGAIKGAGPGKPSESDKAAPKTSVPKVADTESTQNSPPKPGDGKTSKSNPSAPRLTLARTEIVGKPPTTTPPPAPPSDKIDEAVQQQQDLLAEFEKISDELNRVLANLEGSTLVKRLKAASRAQTKVATRLTDQVADTFGLGQSRISDAAARALAESSEQEMRGSQEVSVIMDDLHAYFERRRFMQFKTVLDEMRKLDVIASLRQIGDDLRKEQGVSIAQCEYWSDTLDRWAEDLVDPACNGSCPGGKSKASLPPSVVLEVLQILEKEVNLREETRVGEQSKGALTSDEHRDLANKLSVTQFGLQQRTDKVTQRIRELPESEANFADEIGLLGQVSAVMAEATDILARPETGATAIAAETEAIELLLRSKRINPKSGGGGGSSPGGGGKGTTTDSALALIGSGVNQKEVREDRGVSQSTGESGPTLPEEFRAGLDEYFNRLERGTATPPAGGQ